MALIILAVVFILLYLIFNGVWKPKQFAPGPRWYPYFGSSIALKNACIKQGGQSLGLQALSEQYSTSVLGFKLRGTYLVVLFGKENVKKGLLADELEGRPRDFFMKLRCLGQRDVGITGADGYIWRTNRRFTSTHLKNLGFGRKDMEVEILDELQIVYSAINETPAEISLGQLLAPSILNVLWIFVAGQHIGRNNVRLQKILTLLKLRSYAFSMSGGVLNQWPWMRFIAPDLTGYSLICKLNSELKMFLEEEIALHKNNPTDKDSFIDQYLKEIASGNTEFTEEQLIVICLDLFIAGALTTSSTLDFAFIAMILHPDIQKKVHAEMDNNIGKRRIELSDRAKLTYAEAVLLEVHRYFTIVPLIGPRRALKDFEIDGYIIPKDATVLISAHSVHNDIEMWGDPAVFRPERFIDPEGKLDVSYPLYHFGLGRRRCLGDALAKSAMFLFFAGIMQKYTIKECGEAPSASPIAGLINSPAAYKASFVLRT